MVLSYIAQVQEQYLHLALISSHCLFSNAHRLAFSQKNLHNSTAICAVADATLARVCNSLEYFFASRTQADIHNHPATGSCNNSSSRLAIFLNKHFNTMKISSGLKWSLFCRQCLSLHLQRSVQCCRVATAPFGVGVISAMRPFRVGVKGFLAFKISGFTL